jgi:hypothetical protein
MSLCCLSCVALLKTLSRAPSMVVFIVGFIINQIIQEKTFRRKQNLRNLSEALNLCLSTRIFTLRRCCIYSAAQEIPAP